MISTQGCNTSLKPGKQERAEEKTMRLKNAIRLGAMAIVLLAGTMALPGPASAQVAIGISVGFAPPEIPVYEQPICPGDGYIWTPGFWAWDDDDQDYYWVPGTWVLAPEPGFFWTPGWWGWGGTAFIFHEGYWGPQIGFYGGINYGFGYFGHGYEGGRWEGNRFYYNTTVNRVNTTIIHNTYNTTIVNRNETRVSYNGGNGGISERATSQEEAAARERHISAVPSQQQHFQAARSNLELRASANHGKPPIAATARPGAFSGGGVVAARSGGNYNPPANRGARNDQRTNAERNPGANNPNRPPTATSRNENNANRPPSASNRGETYSHSREVPQHTAPQPDANANKKYQQEQDKLIQKQNQEHQKLQQQQEKEHQRMQQQQSNAAKQQQVEQRHQQQTQQMEQRHTQQQQKLDQRQQPRQQAPPRQSQQRPPNEKHP
jgi:hypothetical protein